jgi:HEAT repeats
MTPKQSVEAECARRGTAAVAAGCAALLIGEDADDALIIALAGPPARYVLDTGPAPVHRYWLRVWGARGLLYAWDDTARPAVLAALADGHWRVREMAAKVVARHLVGEALPAVAGLAGDPVPRVRQTAQRAIARLTAAGA